MGSAAPGPQGGCLLSSLLWHESEDIVYAEPSDGSKDLEHKRLSGNHLQTPAVAHRPPATHNTTS